MTKNTGPRWHKKATILPLQEPHYSFLGRAGSLDLYLANHMLIDGKKYVTVVAEKPRRSGSVWSHTSMIWHEERGTLVPCDADIVPTPYEMCLIYAMWQAYREKKP